MAVRRLIKGQAYSLHPVVCAHSRNRTMKTTDLTFYCNVQGGILIFNGIYKPIILQKHLISLPLLTDNYLLILTLTSGFCYSISSISHWLHILQRTCRIVNFDKPEKSTIVEQVLSTFHNVEGN